MFFSVSLCIGTFFYNAEIATEIKYFKKVVKNLKLLAKLKVCKFFRVNSREFLGKCLILIVEKYLFNKEII